MTVWIGLTGGIGSGKSQVAADFSALGVPRIDADAIARQLTQTEDSVTLQQIRQQFGDDAITLSGCLNRAYMRERVFADGQEKAKLEAILHPLIFAEIQQQQKGFQAAYGVVEIPTLIEHPIFQSLVQRILVVTCPDNIRVQRVMARNGLTEAAVRAIMATQASDEARLRVADDVIANTGSLQDLQQAVEMQHRAYLALFQAA